MKTRRWRRLENVVLHGFLSSRPAVLSYHAPLFDLCKTSDVDPAQMDAHQQQRGWVRIQNTHDIGDGIFRGSAEDGSIPHVQLKCFWKSGRRHTLWLMLWAHHSPYPFGTKDRRSYIPPDGSI